MTDTNALQQSQSPCRGCREGQANQEGHSCLEPAKWNFQDLTQEVEEWKESFNEEHPPSLAPMHPPRVASPTPMEPPDLDTIVEIMASYIFPEGNIAHTGHEHMYDAPNEILQAVSGMSPAQQQFLEYALRTCHFPAEMTVLNQGRDEWKTKLDCMALTRLALNKVKIIPWLTHWNAMKERLTTTTSSTRTTPPQRVPCVSKRAQAQASMAVQAADRLRAYNVAMNYTPSPAVKTPSPSILRKTPPRAPVNARSGKVRIRPTPTALEQLRSLAVPGLKPWNDDTTKTAAPRSTLGCDWDR